MSHSDEKHLEALLNLVFDDKGKPPSVEDLLPFVTPEIRVRVIPRRHYILRALNPFHDLLIVVSGQYYMSRISGNGSQVVIAENPAPCFLGLFQLLYDMPVVTDIVAVTDCLILSLNASWFNRLRLQSGHISNFIIMQLCYSLMSSARRADQSQSLTNDEKMVQFIYNLWLERGMKTEPLVVKSTKEMLANQIGVSLRTLYRSLDRLAETGILTVTPKGFTVPVESLRLIEEQFATMMALELPKRRYRAPK